VYGRFWLQQMLPMMLGAVVMTIAACGAERNSIANSACPHTVM
jgi:hypothetical protein